MIGLFGGSFDPVHTGHLILASSIYDEFSLDKIIFIPNFISPHKQNTTLTDIEHRINMIKLSIKNDNRFEMSTYESDKKRAVYSYETFNYFKDKYSENEIAFIIGNDTYNNLSTWKNYEYLKDAANFIVVRRSGIDKSINTSLNVKFSDSSPEIGISSSIIRKKVLNKLNILYLVNSEVQYYIEEKELYCIRN